MPHGAAYNDAEWDNVSQEHKEQCANEGENHLVIEEPAEEYEQQKGKEIKAVQGVDDQKVQEREDQPRGQKELEQIGKSEEMEDDMQAHQDQQQQGKAQPLTCNVVLEGIPDEHERHWQFQLDKEHNLLPELPATLSDRAQQAGSTPRHIPIGTVYGTPQKAMPSSAAGEGVSDEMSCPEFRGDYRACDLLKHEGGYGQETQHEDRSQVQQAGKEDDLEQEDGTGKMQDVHLQPLEFRHQQETQTPSQYSNLDRVLLQLGKHRTPTVDENQAVLPQMSEPEQQVCHARIEPELSTFEDNTSYVAAGEAPLRDVTSQQFKDCCAN